MNEIEILKFQELKRNTLEALFEAKLPSGMCVRNFSLHRKGTERWIGYPARPYETDGQTKWTNIIFFPDRAVHEKFQAALLRAVDQYLAANGRGKDRQSDGEGVPF